MVLDGAVIPVKPVSHNYYRDETMPTIPILNKCGNLLTCYSNCACSGAGLVKDFAKSKLNEACRQIYGKGYRSFPH